MSRETIEIIVVIFFIILLVGGWALAIYLYKRISNSQLIAKGINQALADRTDTRFGILKVAEYALSAGTMRMYDNSLDETMQRVVNAVLQQPPDEVDQYEKSQNWLYIRFRNLVGTFMTVYVFDMTEYSPHILMTATGYKGTVMRFFTQLVKEQNMLYVEGMVDKDFDVFTHAGYELDTLAILSPNVLEVLHQAPYGATIMIKHDKLYYLLYGKKNLRKTFETIAEHASRAIPVVEEGLRRWARSETNHEKLQKILERPIGMTDKEYFMQPNGKYFTKF